MGLEPGARVADKYTLTEVLGQGGFGTVWRARHEDLGQDVALKLLNPQLADDEESRKRFLREVKIATSFVHPYAVQVREFGRDRVLGSLYFTMDLVEGETLEQALSREGPFAPDRARRLGAQVAEVLEKAHEAGIVHRDLKPANLILTVGSSGEEEVRVLDFGIAKAITSAKKNTTALTLAGTTIGTLPYMSPEQAQGKKLDGRSDLYSLGAVLYQALSGRLPVEADDDAEDTRQSLLFRLVAAAPTPLKERAFGVPVALEEAVMRALEKVPADRFADAAAFREALKADASAAPPAVVEETASFAVTGAQTAAPPRKPSAAPGASDRAPRDLASAPTLPPFKGPFAGPGKRGRGLALLGILLVAGVVAALTYPSWAPVLGLDGSASPSPSASGSPSPDASPGPSGPVSPSAAPTIEIASRPDEPVHGREAEVVVVVSDDAGGPLRLSWGDGHEIQVESGARQLLHLPLETAWANRFALRAWDAEGNEAHETLTIVRDGSPPTLELKRLDRVEMEGKTARWELAVADTGHVLIEGSGGFKQRVRGGERLTLSEKLPRGGRCSWTYSATDAAGNQAKPVTVTIEAVKADIYGLTTAAAKGLSGFRYLDTKTIACGEQSFVIARFEHAQTGLMFHLVPGGTYLRGSKRGDPDEKPVKRVEVKPFLICATECTQAAWKKVMGNTPSHFKGSNRPVEWVSWTEAKGFCQKTKLRLPSEAEWEYACRAGSTSAFAGGASEDALLRMAWFFQNSGSRLLAKGTKWSASKVKGSWGCETHAVGQKPPNAFGLHDMHGNVWEWCEDVYGASYQGAPADGSARTAGASLRVYRGGSWGDRAGNCRSANRYWYSPSIRSNDLGFRPVMSLP